jgi:hypothetical protein
MCYQSVVRRSCPSSAIPMFPLASLAPTLGRWRDEAIDACVSARLHHFVYATDQFRHRYFRDYLYSYASPAMATTFQRFDEHSLVTVQTTPGLQCLSHWQRQCRFPGRCHPPGCNPSRYHSHYPGHRHPPGWHLCRYHSQCQRRHAMWHRCFSLDSPSLVDGAPRSAADTQVCVTRGDTAANRPRVTRRGPI